MKGLKLVSEEKVAPVLDNGRHLVEITSMSFTQSAEGTNQVKAKFTGDKGVGITAWFNLEGYEKDADGNFLRDKNGKRTIDKENTATARRILNNLACHAGIEAGNEYDIEDLVGQQIGIEVVTNDQGYKRVAYTTEASKASVSAFG